MSGHIIEPCIIFMGTPEFAVPSLRALAQGPYRLTVITQPDRPSGRGGKQTPPPVKIAAQELDLPILQPVSLKDPDFRGRLASIKPELTVLVAYGEYLALSLLDLPAHGSINLHPSLLPRWRGSTPIQSPILEGDSVTGVTIIRMDRGLDTGPIIAQKKVPLAHDETYKRLSEQLAQLGATLLVETIPGWLTGQIRAVPQPEEGVTLSRILTREDGLIDWKMSAEQIWRRVRALQPWPGTYTTWLDRTIKVLQAQTVQLGEEQAQVPGTVQVVRQGKTRRLLVWTGSGTLELQQVQLTGKAPVEAQALLTGYPQIEGSVLGEAEVGGN